MIRYVSDQQRKEVSEDEDALVHNTKWQLREASLSNNEHFRWFQLH